MRIFPEDDPEERGSGKRIWPRLGRERNSGEEKISGFPRKGRDLKSSMVYEKGSDEGLSKTSLTRQGRGLPAQRPQANLPSGLKISHDPGGGAARIGPAPVGGPKLE